jgi:hypothetical protein
MDRKAWARVRALGHVFDTQHHLSEREINEAITTRRDIFKLGIKGLSKGFGCHAVHCCGLVTHSAVHL